MKKFEVIKNGKKVAELPLGTFSVSNWNGVLLLYPGSDFTSIQNDGSQVITEGVEGDDITFVPVDD